MLVSRRYLAPRGKNKIRDRGNQLPDQTRLASSRLQKLARHSVPGCAFFDKPPERERKSTEPVTSKLKRLRRHRVHVTYVSGARPSTPKPECHREMHGIESKRRSRRQCRMRSAPSRLPGSAAPTSRKQFGCGCCRAQ